MSKNLTGKKILIIGRGSGIAQAIAETALAEGAEIIVAGRNPSMLRETYADRGGVRIESVDVTDEASVESLSARIAPDHIVSTASARARGTLGQLDQAALAASFATKVIGPFLLAKHFGPKMPTDGSLVLLSGATAVKPTVGVLGVAATNAAVDSLAKSLALELAPIRVNAVSPGTIDTGAYDALGDEKKRALYEMRAATNPVRRIGDASDIAEAVIFAMTSSFLTGVSLTVDGGETLL